MRLFFTSSLIFLGITLSAQNVALDASYNDLPLSEFVKKVESDQDVEVIMHQSIPDLITNNIDRQTFLLTYLRDLLEPYGSQIIRLNNKLVLIVPEEIYQSFGTKNDNYKIYTSSSATGQSTYPLSGQIIDKYEKVPIMGVQVINTTSWAGSITDENGRFQLKIPKGMHIIEARFVGYETQSYVVYMEKEGSLDFILQESTTELDELVISAQAENENVQSQKVGTEVMSIQSIKTLPTFLGEIDPIKSISSLPGVQTNELSSGFNVRGGESGQNLILQDEALIVNPTHMFGFFSGFNPDLINNVTLSKGGGPASNGGRVSSILGVSLREGNDSQFRLSGSAGVVSSRLTLETPIVRDQSSIIVGGRIAYPNWIMRQSKNKDINENEASFYDITTKITHQFNDRNIVDFTLYKSHDDFLFSTDSVINEWNTLNFSGSWRHQLPGSQTLEVSLAKSKYDTYTQGEGFEGRFESETQLDNIRLKASVIDDVTATMNITSGLEINRYELNTGNRISIPEDPSTNIDPSIHHMFDAAIFSTADWEITPSLSAIIGVRLSGMARVGEGTAYEFDYTNIDGNLPTISDSTVYGEGEVMDTQWALEPRISFRYLITPTFSLKGSFYRSAQYVHLISNTTSSTPQDYFVASGKNLEKQLADQYSIGLFKNLKSNQYEVSGEVFYKNIQNSVDFVDGADITQNPKVEQSLLQGKGKAYGLETMIKKNKGDFTGWVAYTYSRSLKQIITPEEMPAINNDEFYPTNFDQPHDLTIVAQYQQSDRVQYSVNFSYKTGRPITIPISLYTGEDVTSINIFSERNKFRIPDYHRMDLSATVKDKNIQNRRLKGEWIFSIYNVYGRKNAYSVFFDKTGRAKKLYVLGQVFPSISYNFKF